MTATALPDSERVASFDVDAQCTFTPLCPDELPVPGGDEIAGSLNRQAGLAGWRLGSKDSHSPDAVWVTDDPERIGQPGVGAENANEFWPVHAVPGTRGFELLPGLPRPAEYDFFVWKGVELDMHPYGACYHDLDERMSTGVIEFLRQRGIDTVLVGGLAADFCVKATAIQLARAGLRTLLVRESTRGISAEGVEQAERMMADAGVEFVDRLDDLTVAG